MKNNVSQLQTGVRETLRHLRQDEREFYWSLFLKYLKPFFKSFKIKQLISN